MREEFAFEVALQAEMAALQAKTAALQAKTAVHLQILEPANRGLEHILPFKDCKHSPFGQGVPVR